MTMENLRMKCEDTVFSGRKMATALPKNAKHSRMEMATRRWVAKPILGSEYSEDPPLEEVYVGLLKEKKDISTAIQSISNILPGFHHLKRCSSKRILLAALNSSKVLLESEETSEIKHPLTQDELKTFLQKRSFNLSLLEDDFHVLKVPAKTPKTKSQAARASKIWPVNFHPDPNIESLIDGSIFTEHQLELIENYMNVTLEAAKLEAVGNAECNGSAVIVDPDDGKILAIAASKIDKHPMWHAAMLAVDLVARLQGGGAWELNEESPNFPQYDVTKLDPRGDVPDSAQTSNTETISCCQVGDKDPTKMESNIKRKYVEEAPLCYPKSLSKICLPQEKTLKSSDKRRGRKNNGTSKIQPESLEKNNTMDSEKHGPYLCTGYWTFLLREPCPLCAMALLHSRVSRIFYGLPNPNTGVLGSKAVLHSLPGLNHRYQVWSGILEEECQQMWKAIEDKNID